MLRGTDNNTTQQGKVSGSRAQTGLTLTRQFVDSNANEKMNLIDDMSGGQQNVLFNDLLGSGKHADAAFLQLSSRPELFPGILRNEYPDWKPAEQQKFASLAPSLDANGAMGWGNAIRKAQGDSGSGKQPASLVKQEASPQKDSFDSKPRPDLDVIFGASKLRSTDATTGQFVRSDAKGKMDLLDNMSGGQQNVLFNDLLGSGKHADAAFLQLSSQPELFPSILRNEFPDWKPAEQQKFSSIAPSLDANDAMGWADAIRRFQS